MSVRFQTARFNILSGPASLFERITFKFSEVRTLRTNSEHFQLRALERDAPLDELKLFNPNKWKLILAEVRIDTGKFVNSTWDVNVNDAVWRVVIGLHDTVQTVVRVDKNKPALGESIVRCGPLYDFVESINRNLMKLENRPDES